MSAARKAASVARRMIALLALMTALLGSLLLAAQPAAASAAISATGSTAASSYAYDGFLHLSQPAQLPPLSVSLDRDAEAKTRPSSVGQADRVAGAVRLTSAHAYVYDVATYSYGAVVSPSLEAPGTLSLACAPSGPTLAGSQPEVAVSASYRGAAVAAEAGGGETTTLWRAVGQGEADDIAATSGYRNAPGLQGKYFFKTRGQAEQYGQMMNKSPAFGAPNYLTSGSVPTSALGSAEGMEAGSEGPGLFFRGDLGDFFDVLVHGLIP